MKHLENQITTSLRKIWIAANQSKYTVPKEIFFYVDNEQPLLLEYKDGKDPFLSFWRACERFDKIWLMFMIAHEVYHIIDPLRKFDGLSQEQFLKNPTKTWWIKQRRINFRSEFRADRFAQKILWLLGYPLFRLPEDGTENEHIYKYGATLLKAKYWKPSEKDFNLRTHPSNEQRNRALQKCE